MNFFGGFISQLGNNLFGKAKPTDMMAASVFVIEAIQILSTIDANMDGKVDGKEKMQAAKKMLSATLKDFPAISEKFKLEPEKTELFLTKLVEAFDVIVK